MQTQSGGVFEDTPNDSILGAKSEIDEVLEDNIAKTCLHILVSLVNQNMRVTSKNKKAEKAFKEFNKKVKIKRKMDSIVFNQLGWGNSVFFYDVTTPKLMVYDTRTYDVVHDVLKDEFKGIYQRVTYTPLSSQKEGMSASQYEEFYIPEENLILVPGIGKAQGESLLKQAYPYVKAKTELVNSLYDLVTRLGLLTVVGVDLPGDIADDDVEEYLDEIESLVIGAKANSTWILPKDCTVEGVKGSGEARIIESVKVHIEMLDEEIRKCLFVPDTFLTSLSANRATAKEQRYLIASMVSHIRDLVEESLTDLYDRILEHEEIDAEYEFSWGNINLPEPEKLFDFIIQLLTMDGITLDEVRSYINLGSLPKELLDKKKEEEEKGHVKPVQVVGPWQSGNDEVSGDGGDPGQVQPGQGIK